MKEDQKIAYIMSRFPGLSETFILREMCELERCGWHLELYPLIFQQEAVVHGEALAWIERAHRPTWLEILVANLRLFVKHPVVYLSVFLRAVIGNIFSLKFLLRAIVVFPKAIWMARQMSLNNIAHVHAHYASHPALAAWIIYQITGIPYSITVHAHDIFVDKSMLDQKLQDARKIVAISQYNRNYLIDLLGSWVGEKIEIIHCGVVPDQYASKSFSVSQVDAGFNILSVGSLRPYKGFSFLLDACNIMRRNGISFHCRIVGSGELYDSLLAKIDELNLQDCVELLGPKTQNEVARLLKSADCYVQPSIITVTGKMEGIPVSLMEAMASELPVIATNISGVPELVQHGKTGYLVRPEDPGGLADAIMHVRANPIEANSCAVRGKDYVVHEFDLSANVARLSNMFDLFIEDSKWK